MTYKTSQRELIEFIRKHQIVAESAKGLPVPSLIRHMVGTDYPGGWWSLENSSALYNALQGLRAQPEIHVCKLAKGKVTLVHQDSLLPLVSLASRFPPSALDKVVEEHFPNGKHRTTQVPTDVWWPASATSRSPLLSEQAALTRLDELCPGLSWLVRRLFA